MAIKRCPYCRSIIDEKDQYCNNCGTQLLFPEDEFIEDDIPGEKAIDLEEEPAGDKLDEELILEEPEPAQDAKSASSFVFPESLTGDSTTLPIEPASTRSGKDKEIREAALETPVEFPREAESEAETPTGRSAAEMPFDEVFSSKLASAKIPPQPQRPSATRADLSETLGQTSLSASAEEIEDIARIMSSLGKDARETTGSGLKKEAGATSAGSGRAAKKDASEELKKSAADIPPWATGLRVEPPSLEKIDLPGLEPAKPQSETPAGLDDFFSSIEKHTAEASSGQEKMPSSKSWADIPDREELTRDSLAARLGREGRERDVPLSKTQRRAGGGSKLKAKILDVLIIALCWAAAVWLATRILSVSILTLFEAALVPLLLFLLTLGVAYFFLFLYFLGETLGDRLSSS
ncbi:MAG: zinc ribbon domain-containing protein [Candidatus Aminicenantes bacterium]|nr:zinc ribbon domain-containing protein [Candidatus Aminicenantes bacterium]